MVRDGRSRFRPPPGRLLAGRRGAHAPWFVAIGDKERDEGMYASSADQYFVKAYNRAVVLNCLRQRGPISRADIAKLTGLNKTTVSALVDDLAARHLVSEVGMGESTGGRPPRLLTLNPVAGCAIGADLGVDYLLVVVLNLRGQPLWRRRVSSPERGDPRTGVSRLADLIEVAMASGGPTPLGVLGIGVGVPGIVEYPGGRLVFAPNLGWQDVPVARWLEERFEVPVQVDNEANAGALAEMWTGPAEGTGNLLYLSVGAGLGAGIVINGEVYRGVTGAAGEFGHTTVDPAGRPCSCGNRGCLEVFASERALLAQLLHQRGAAPAGTDAVFRAADSGDSAAIAALARVGEYLGIGVANAINTFNPEVVVIGGPMARGGHHVLNSVRRVVEKRALAFPGRNARIVTSALGEDACAVGAGIMILQEFFRIPGTSEDGPLAGISLAHRGIRREEDGPAWQHPRDPGGSRAG